MVNKAIYKETHITFGKTFEYWEYRGKEYFVCVENAHRPVDEQHREEQARIDNILKAEKNGKIFDIDITYIDPNGHQYIFGMLEKPKHNQHGYHDSKAFNFFIEHNKPKTTLEVFYWLNGEAVNFKKIREFDEILDEGNIEKILYENGLVT